MTAPAEVLDRIFWTKVNLTPTGCWEWTGSRRSSKPYGYGVITRGGRLIYAHRHAYELAKGPVPEGLVVRHHCDNPPCIRPFHLAVGTHAENIADMMARGRQNYRRGSAKPMAKLTEVSVAEIRRRFRAGERRVALAAEFGVSVHTLGAVLSGRSWKHVP